jgi:hypothetical protein
MMDGNDNFTGARKDTYWVNGQIIGLNPENIERNQAYSNFYSKIGDSKNNIKIINNFLNKREIQLLMSGIPNAKFSTFVAQKDDKGEALVSLNRYYMKDIFKTIDKVKKEVIKAYEVENIKAVEERGISIVRWDKGSYLTLHADDLGYVPHNNIAVLIYLNDDYEGGEINFPTHDLCIKPEVGSLLIFPGSLNYPHEVKEVLSGTRYTVALWFSIV